MAKQPYEQLELRCLIQGGYIIFARENPTLEKATYFEDKAAFSELDDALAYMKAHMVNRPSVRVQDKPALKQILQGGDLGPVRYTQTGQAK